MWQVDANSSVKASNCVVHKLDASRAIVTEQVFADKRVLSQTIVCVKDSFGRGAQPRHIHGRLKNSSL